MEKLKNLPMYVLGSLIVIGFFGLLAVLILVGIPTQNETLLNISIGALIASFSNVVGYYFGSSKSSADKNEMLNNQPKA